MSFFYQIFLFLSDGVDFEKPTLLTTEIVNDIRDYFGAIYNVIFDFVVSVFGILQAERIRNIDTQTAQQSKKNVSCVTDDER
jgi:hypothetical protein